MIKRMRWLSSLFIALLVASCSLDIEGTDSVIQEGEEGTFSGVESVETSVQNLYNSLNGLGDQANYFALVEVSTDELLVPTRGTDWGDNGIWRTLHNHTWASSHDYVLNVWNQFNQNIFNATEAIDARSTSGRTDALVAEAQFVRAFSMWAILDLYGQVPFREPDQDATVDPIVYSRTEAYDIALADLNAAIPNLPDGSPGNGTDRATKAAAYYLRAKMRLNAHIYNGSGSPSDADLNAVISDIDAIEALGFGLERGFFQIFEESVDNETIWWIPTGVGNRMWNGLHYNQTVPDNTGGGWNGFSTLAEFYDLFEGPANDNTHNGGQEERRGYVPTLDDVNDSTLGIGYGFLIGQQVGATGFNEDGSPAGYANLNDRSGNPLSFTKELPGLSGNTEVNGIRVIKYHPANGAFTGHEIMFRFADAYLMRAEARMRLGNDITSEVNALRTLRNASALSSVSESDLLDERGRELYMETWRRNDLIRFGQFTKDWEFKNADAVGDETKNLYPIPSTALLSNPNLTQNPGY